MKSHGERSCLRVHFNGSSEVIAESMLILAVDVLAVNFGL